VCLFSTNLYFLNLLMTVCILDSLDKTPKVGDRLLLNPPTQGNINTEKKWRTLFLGVRYKKNKLCLSGLRASYCTRTLVSACPCC
jgi:hypothetical protein